ncbi:MAG TPA: hypothetical protein VFQ35_15220 [Polyangiaceae bacterium]|nr:hypothetical protein [Polyangiaceae bacterium]
MSLIASEPLAVTSVVSLVKGEESVPLQPQVGGAPPSIATFQTGNFLPFGSTWQVQATGEDLAGLPITTAEPVVVSTDPGVFAEDGFEAKPSMAVEGGVALVSQVGGVPALSGSQSLLMHSDAVVLFHLSRRAGATAVRFTAQMFSMNADSVSLPSIVAGVIGESKYLQVRSTPSDSPVVPTMDPSLAYAGPKQEVLLPIGEDGSDIALKIQMRMKCSTFCTDSRALLIDDLRVE